ncbi:MAG: tetratricopeptide repeat protein, partial [Desulfosporosinus sp.]
GTLVHPWTAHKGEFMLKRSRSSYIILASILLVITTIIVLYYLPKYKTAPTNVPINSSPSPVDPLTVSIESNGVPSSPTSTTPLTPSSALPPLHVSDSKALALYDQGLKLYYQRQFPEALVLLNQALAVDAQCYEALNAKGATLAFQGRYDQGLALIQQALDLNPSFVYGHFNQGLANELAGRWDPSIAAYQKALQLDDRNTWSYYGIASIYGRLGNIDKVLEYLQPAITLDPDVKEAACDEKDFASVRKDPRFQALVKP